MLFSVIGLRMRDLLYFLAYHLQRFEHFCGSVLNLWQFIRDPSFDHYVENKVRQKIDLASLVDHVNPLNSKPDSIEDYQETATPGEEQTIAQ